MFTVAGVAGICVLSTFLGYNIKTRMGIDLNLLGEGHTPQKLENLTKGVVKCTWFANPHHCDCNKKH